LLLEVLTSINKEVVTQDSNNNSWVVLSQCQVNKCMVVTNKCKTEVECHIEEEVVEEVAVDKATSKEEATKECQDPCHNNTNKINKCQ